MSYLIDTKAPGDVNYMITRLVPRTWAATIPRIDHREMGTNAPCNWRLTVPKTTKMMLAVHWWPIWRWLLQMTVLFLHVALSHPSPADSAYKCSHPFLSGGDLAFGQMSATSPHIVASIWNKANFLFRQPGLFTGFWVASSWTPHAYLLVTASK